MNDLLLNDVYRGEKESKRSGRERKRKRGAKERKDTKRSVTNGKQTVGPRDGRRINYES